MPELNWSSDTPALFTFKIKNKVSDQNMASSEIQIEEKHCSLGFVSTYQTSKHPNVHAEIGHVPKKFLHSWLHKQPDKRSAKKSRCVPEHKNVTAVQSV